MFVLSPPSLPPARLKNSINEGGAGQEEEEETLLWGNFPLFLTCVEAEIEKKGGTPFRTNKRPPLSPFSIYRPPLPLPFSSASNRLLAKAKTGRGAIFAFNIGRR